MPWAMMPAVGCGLPTMVLFVMVKGANAENVRSVKMPPRIHSI